MTKPIYAKKGSPEFEATFSFVHEISLYTRDNKTKKFLNMRLKPGMPWFIESVELIKEHSAEIVVEEVHLFDKTILYPGPYAIHKLAEIGFPDRMLLDASVYTKDIQTIKRQAKELRADKAVARVTKVPLKPKAGIKTRRDII